MQEHENLNFGLRRLASRVSLAVAVTLVVLKLAAWVVTGSVVLLTSAVDALVDTGDQFRHVFRRPVCGAAT